MKTHMVRHMDQKVRHQCLICGKSFSHRNSLEVHKRLHAGSLPFKCDYCEKTFQTSWNRTKHHNVHKKIAEEKGIQVMDTKTKGSKVTKMLYEEMNDLGVKTPGIAVKISKDEIKKQHECQFCDKTFKKRFTKQRHEIIHTGIYSSILRI